MVVVANLKEKPLVGYPSHGMVLCACKEDHSAVQVLFFPSILCIGSGAAH